MPLLDDILGSGVDILIGLDPREGKGTDLQKVKEKFKASSKCIWGGVSGALTVEQGSEAETEVCSDRSPGASWGQAAVFILSPVDKRARRHPQRLEEHVLNSSTPGKSYRQDFL